MREEITLKELFEKYDDCSVENHESYLIECMMWDVKDGGRSEDEIVYIAEMNENDLDDEGFLNCSEMQQWAYVPGKTYSISDETNCWTEGFVYKK